MALLGRVEAFERLEALREEVDRDADALHEKHASRLQCARGCAQCCVDDIRVFEIEAEWIRARHVELLEEGAPHAVGACAFLDDERACRIYPDRPYVCRTQGLPLRWLVHETQSEHRDVCPLNEAGPPIETLPAEECWTLGPVEDRLASLQAEIDGGERRRVPLRDLFRRRAEKG